MPRLEARNIHKRYGDVVALDGVSATFEPGEIHAVLGENGAGKSTFMDVLAGFVRPDSGSVALDGTPTPLGKSFECRRLGIEKIHQHFTLVPEYTVEENLALARLPGLARAISPSDLASPALELGRKLGWTLDPKAKVRTLPVGLQQRLEIMKALAANAPIMIFDEPTAVLSLEEVDELFRVLGELKHEGRTVILIAHKLSEIMKIADRVTVLRAGRLVGEAAISDVDEQTLATWMVGELPTKIDSGAKVHPSPGWSFAGLSLQGDRGETAVRDVAFELRRGEILGFGGVDGNGQVELAEYLAGVRRPAGGPVMPMVDRLAYIPQDRQIDGLALNMTVQENMTVTGQRLPEFTSGPLLLVKKLRDWAKELIKSFEIRVPGPDSVVGSLSGGNQQKVVVSRSLSRQPDLVVAVNPTRGLDLRATSFVRQQLSKARDGGAAVALFTTDLDELFEISDRQLFMSAGKLVEPKDATSMLGGRE